MTVREMTLECPPNIGTATRDPNLVTNAGQSAVDLANTLPSRQSMLRDCNIDTVALLAAGNSIGPRRQYGKRSLPDDLVE